MYFSWVVGAGCPLSISAYSAGRQRGGGWFGGEIFRGQRGWCFNYGVHGVSVHAGGRDICGGGLKPLGHLCAAMEMVGDRVVDYARGFTV